jgi:NAD(P)-dependent dehydrogenase (short-subunit alcohol dehydrogenase family)
LNKTALITGCSSGIGRATARLFAGKGWNVVASMRRPEAEREPVALGNAVANDPREQKGPHLREAAAQERQQPGHRAEASLPIPPPHQQTKGLLPSADLIGAS